MVSYEKIRKALRSVGNTVTLTDLAIVAETGKVRGWTEENSILIAGVHHDALVFHLAAGDLKEVLSMLEGAYEWGREHGATRAVFIGRRGWVKSLVEELGWAVTGSLLLYERDI